MGYSRAQGKPFFLQGSLADREAAQEEDGDKSDKGQPERQTAQHLPAAVKVQVRPGLFRERFHREQLAQEGFDGAPGLSQSCGGLTIQSVVRVVPKAKVLVSVLSRDMAGETQGRDACGADRSPVQR